MASQPPPPPQDDDDDEGLDAFHASSFVGTSYELLKRLGKGGMGVVFQARHRTTGHICALKTLHRQFARDRELVSRLRLEAKILRQLRHPNVVVILDAGTTPDGLAFYVMELLGGMTLREVSRVLQGRLSLRWVLTIALELLEGLRAAHAIGVLHRDIKPHNIFVTEAGTVKLIDFGVAKAVFTVEGKDPTKAGVFLGTFSHTAPETMNGRPATVQSDIYSVGVVLWELIVGKPPFLDDENVPWTVSDIVTKGVPRLEDVGFGHVPSRLSTAVRRATYVDPALRYPSVGALADDLREVLARLPADDPMPGRASFPSLPPAPADAPDAAKGGRKQSVDEGDLTVFDEGLPGRVGATLRIGDASVVVAPGDFAAADLFDQTRREASPFGAGDEHSADVSQTEALEEQSPPSQGLPRSAGHPASGSTAHSRPTEPNAHLSSYLAQIDPDGSTVWSQAAPAIAPPAHAEATKRSALQLPSAENGPSVAAAPSMALNEIGGGLRSATRGFVGQPELSASTALGGTSAGDPGPGSVPHRVAAFDIVTRLAADEGGTKRSLIHLIGGSTPGRGEPLLVRQVEGLLDPAAPRGSALEAPRNDTRGSTDGADQAPALGRMGRGNNTVVEPAPVVTMLEGAAAFCAADGPGVDSPEEMLLSSGRSVALDDESTELRLRDEWDRTATVREPQRPSTPSSSKRDAAYGPVALGLSGFRQSLADYRERPRQDGVGAVVSTSEDGVVHALVPVSSDAWAAPPAVPANGAGPDEPAVVVNVGAPEGPPPSREGASGMGRDDLAAREATAASVSREPEAHETPSPASAEPSAKRDSRAEAVASESTTSAGEGPTPEVEQAAPKNAADPLKALSDEESSLLRRLVNGDEGSALELEKKLLPVMWMLNGTERLTAVKVLVRDRVGIRAAPSETDAEEQATERAVRQRAAAEIDGQCAGSEWDVRYALLRPGLRVPAEVAPARSSEQSPEPGGLSPLAFVQAPSPNEEQLAAPEGHVARAEGERAVAPPAEAGGGRPPKAGDKARKRTSSDERPVSVESRSEKSPERPPAAEPGPAGGRGGGGAVVPAKAWWAFGPPSWRTYVLVALAVVAPGLLGAYLAATVGSRPPAPAAGVRPGATTPALPASASAPPGAAATPSVSTERTAPHAPRP